MNVFLRHLIPLLQGRGSRILSIWLVIAGLMAGLWLPLLLSAPAVAQSSDIAVLLEEAPASKTLTQPLSRSEEVLLLSLKQVNQNFTTIQLEELTIFKGKLLVVPISDQTSQAFLDAVLKKKSSNTHIMLLPMLMLPNPRVETFLDRMGFTLAGSRYLSRSLPLMLNGRQANRYIPIGSFIYRTSPNLATLAYWGDDLPAAVVSGNTMMLNWNFTVEIPEDTLRTVLQLWHERDITLALNNIAPQQGPSNFSEALMMGSPPVAILKEADKAPSTETDPDMSAHSLKKLIEEYGKSPSEKPVQKSITEKPSATKVKDPAKTSPPAATTTTSVQKPLLEADGPSILHPRQREGGTVESSVAPATRPEKQPATASTTAEENPRLSFTPAMPHRTLPRAQQEEEESEESYPESLYEFDQTPQAVSKRRGIDVQNAMAEFYNERMREMAELQDKVNLLAAQNLNHPERHKAIQQALTEAMSEKSRFETAWFQRNFGHALGAFEQSKAILMKTLFNKMPETSIEGRAIWLDRGSIVESGSPDGLRSLIRRISNAGFNVIYFETVNAGYPVYPSKIIEQNPLIKGWDPLAVAVDEAHKQGVELHAWVWVFAVGNTRHNRILGQPDSYPGPILSRPEMMAEAMRGRGGELIPANQHEYWLSPASFKARSFLINLYSEIVRNYPVDGLHLDYIRYPFQKPNIPMGLEGFAVSRFQSETGLSLSTPTEHTTRAWMAWKAFQVTTFVKDVTLAMKGINPDVKISAAVFPMARHGRMMMIQQDWETWVRNGWIDTLNPMAYSRSARSLERLVQYIHNIGDDKTLVYPGLSLNKLNSIELLDTLEVCRRTGVMGTTLFATAQLDTDKQMVLQTGPYKQRKTIPPHRDPLGASLAMVTDTREVVDSLLKNGQIYQGVDTLRLIGNSLSLIEENLTRISRNKNSLESGFLISGVRDESRQLRQYAERWAERSDDALASFQAKVVRQMVDKTVRMLNYTTFQMAARPRTGKMATSTTAATWE